MPRHGRFLVSSESYWGDHGAQEELEDEPADTADSPEVWQRREAARLRQIMIGKARPEYKRFLLEVPVDCRNDAHPSTPDPRAKVSKRQFDRSLGEWRRRLHEYDPPQDELRDDYEARMDYIPALPSQQHAIPVGPAPLGTAAGLRYVRRQRPVRTEGVLQLRLADSLEPPSHTPMPWVYQAPETTCPPCPPAPPMVAAWLASDPETPIRPPRSWIDMATPPPVSHPAAPNWSQASEVVRFQKPFLPEVIKDMDRDMEVMPPSSPVPSARKDLLEVTPKAQIKTARPTPSPPTSTIRTPQRGHWVTETPSPQCFHHSFNGFMVPAFDASTHQGANWFDFEHVRPYA